MKLNIEEQLAAAKELLASQGRTTEEIDYFESTAKGLIQKITGLFAKHYSVLCGLAYENGKAPDAHSAVKFSFGTIMDMSDLEVCDLRTTITYNKPFKEMAAIQCQVSEEDPQEKLPLDAQPGEDVDPELPDDPNGVDPQPPDEQHPEEPALPAESPESEGTPATAGV